jgi:hypothetical protein
MAGGAFTDEHPEPELPAEAATKIPAAWVLFTIVSNSAAVAHSAGGSEGSGQPQELFRTCARNVGFALLPARSVGAIMNWKHSV